MRHGLTILTDLPWPEARPRWEAAEAMGFDHAWTYDHLIWSGLPESPWVGAFPTLAAAAMVTERIGLGALVASPNYRHPYALLRDAVGLAEVSGDRFLLGLGTGGDGDARRLGEDLTLRQRVDRFHEYVDLLDRLLREDDVSHVGTFYEVQAARTLPGPARERIPLWIAANGPRSIALAAAHGDAWITYGGHGERVEDWFAHLGGLLARLEDAEAAVADMADLATGAEGEVGRARVRRVLSLDSSPQFSLASVGVFEEMTGRAAEMGFDDVISHWPRPEGPYAGDERVLEAVAATFGGGAGEGALSGSPQSGASYP